MAQSGFTPILIYASGTATNVPLAANLTSSASGAELALNYADGKLYYKNSAGVVTLLAGAGGTGIVAGSNTQIQFNNSGVFGASASLTWDGTSLTASNFVSAGNITINTNKFTVVGSSGNTVIGGTATVNSLTSGRVTFAGASGLLSDSANLTWNGTSLAVTGTVAVTGALTATLDSTFSSTGALLISKGTTGQRPTPASGMLRFNTTTTEFEGYNGTTWASVGGAALSNDTSTATDVFPLFANATTGTASTLFTSNAKLLYKPSTGEFQASVPVALNGIVVNSQTVGTSYTIAAGYSAMSAGPITLSGGVVVTVTSGSRWVVQ
jgi:hypothetical protein